MIFDWHARKEIQQVEMVLSKRFGSRVSLKFGRFIRKPSIYSLRVLNGPAELGDSIIVKGLRRRENHTGYETSYPATQWMFYNDWASLQFLQQEAQLAAISPRLYAVEHEHHLLVIEDLKNQAYLGAFLDGKDAAQAAHILAQWGTALGKLHASTIGKQAIFDDIRDKLAPRVPSWGWVPPWQRSPAIYRSLIESLPTNIRDQGFESFQWMPFVLRQICDFLSISLSDQAEDELMCAVAELQAPGPFLAYTHGDLCSENCLITEQGLKFVDFENGTYKHALIDAVYPRMCFPSCWNAKQLPLSVVKKTEQHYRNALISGCPEAADERIFAHALVHACVYWALLSCQFNALERLTAKDDSWCPASLLITTQQRIIIRCERLAQVCTEADYLHHLGELFQTIATSLKKRWPAQTHQFPPYRAFKAL